MYSCELVAKKGGTVLGPARPHMSVTHHVLTRPIFFCGRPRDARRIRSNLTGEVAFRKVSVGLRNLALICVKKETQPALKVVLQ